MNNILILYPKEFQSYSKFSRKISTITKNMETFNIYYFEDFHNFILNYSKENSKFINIKKTNDFKEISHTIFFDDGEEFLNEKYYCKNNNIPIRVIKILITRVINIKNEPQYNENNKNYKYIGRGSYWGNPYSLFDNNGTRDHVIEQFKFDFENDYFPNKKKSEVYKLAGKRLACFCKPKRCHGDVLAIFLNSFDDGK